MPSPIPGPYPYATQTLPGLVSTDAQTFGGAKTFASLATTGNATVGGTFYAGGNIIGDSSGSERITFAGGGSSLTIRGSNGSLSGDRAVTVGPALAYASVHADAELLRVATGIGGTENGRLAIYRGSQIFGFELGSPGMPNTARLKLDNAVGWNLSYNATGGSLTIDSEKYRLTSGSATGLIIDSSSNSQVVSPGKVLFVYASGSSGITETIRLVNNRADAGLKSVVVGTEHATPNGFAVLFQVAHSITTAATDAGNGTGLFKVYGAGNCSIPTGAAIYFGGAISTGCYVYGASTSQLELGCSNATVLTLTSTNASFTGNVRTGSSSGLTMGAAGLAVSASSFTADYTAGWAITDNATAEAFRFLSTTTFANLEASVATWRNSNLFATAPVARLRASGRFDQAGTDSTGTPGAASINKPIGKSSIALGAASVVITNTLVTATSHCIITPHARDATCKELIAVCTANTITVSGSAAAAADLPFSWEVKTLL